MAKKDILDIQVLEDQTIYINMFLTPMWIRTLELSNSRIIKYKEAWLWSYYVSKHRESPFAKNNGSYVRITMKFRRSYSSMPGWRN